MVFSSIPFLFYYLPCVLALYYLVPARGKNFILLLASLFFYAWGEPKYLLFMVLAEAIQAEPAAAAEESWGVTVIDGKITNVP